jgi:hypothetical protein
MAEPAENRRNDLYAYYRRTVADYPRQGKEGSIARGIRANLKEGGAGSLNAFLLVAEAVSKDGQLPQEEALVDWVERSFPIMWKEDIAVLTASLLNCVIKNGLLNEVMK